MTNNPLDIKSLRLTNLLNVPTPQQLHDTEARLARLAMDSYTNPPTLWVDIKEEHEEQNKDSIETVKRANPKVGRSIKPQR